VGGAGHVPPALARGMYASRLPGGFICRGGDPGRVLCSWPWTARFCLTDRELLTRYACLSLTRRHSGQSPSLPMAVGDGCIHSHSVVTTSSNSPRGPSWAPVGIAAWQEFQ
jgi:hypothetical protein